MRCSSAIALEPHTMEDSRVQFVDRTGVAFAMEWWSDRSGFVLPEQIAAVVGDWTAGRMFGSAAADFATVEVPYGTPEGSTLASTRLKEDRRNLVDPAGRTDFPVPWSWLAQGRPDMAKASSRAPAPRLVSQAKVVAESNPTCSTSTRALSCAMVDLPRNSPNRAHDSVTDLPLGAFQRQNCLALR